MVNLLPAPVAYVLEVVSSDDPEKYSVNDAKCSSLSKADRNWIVGLFDGYGLQTLARGWNETGRLRLRYGGQTYDLDGSDVGTWTASKHLSEVTFSGSAGSEVCDTRKRWA